MADDLEPTEVDPGPKTWLGRQLWDVRGVLTGPPGKRSYDKKRVTVLVVLLLTVQAGVQLATKVIVLQFEAQDKLFTALLANQVTQHKETVDRADNLTKAIDRFSCELHANNDTSRAIVWRERSPERKDCK